MQNFFKQLIPFIFFGIAIVAFALGIMILAYLFLIGAAVGLILFFISYIRTKLFAPKKPTEVTRTGRVIDSDDWKKM